MGGSGGTSLRQMLMCTSQDSVQWNKPCRTEPQNKDETWTP